MLKSNKGEIMKIDTSKLFWIRQPENYLITDNKIEIITSPNTDLWQKTYYGFQNDNAPVLQKIGRASWRERVYEAV